MKAEKYDINSRKNSKPIKTEVSLDDDPEIFC